jgi:hypothetical protein
MKTNEVWKSIKDYPNYQISNLGNVKSLNNYKRNYYKILSPSLSKSGYYQIGIRLDKKRIYHTIHRLIAIHFIDNNENYKCVNHKDGNKLNNSIENLEWCSYSINNKHAYDNGLNKNNENHGRSKLSNSDVLLIKESLINNISQRKLAIQFNVSQACINYINVNKTWANL